MDMKKESFCVRVPSERDKIHGVTVWQIEEKFVIAESVEKAVAIWRVWVNRDCQPTSIRLVSDFVLVTESEG